MDNSRVLDSPARRHYRAFRTGEEGKIKEKVLRPEESGTADVLRQLCSKLSPLGSG